jgi:Bifunctional DNA primase/polymerase, N-terminal
MGPFEEHAERLLERGYAVVPIIPGTKKPGFFHNGNWVGLREWTKRFDGRSSLNNERRVWGRNGAGIGVLAGPVSGDLIGVDIDTEDPQIVAALRAVLPPTEVKKAGAKGETRFYRGPGIVSRSWSIDGRRIVEIIGPGRQTVLPPSAHPDGVSYRWLGPETLEDLEPRELPMLPADIADAIDAVLAPFGYQLPPVREAGEIGETTPHRQLNEAALAKLDAWVPALQLYKARRTPRGYEAVAVWRPSSSGRPDQARSRNLKIVPQGIRDWGDGTGYTPLDLTMAALGCDLDAALTFLSDRLGWGTADVSIRLAGNFGNLVSAVESGTKFAGNGAPSARNDELEDDVTDEARAGPDPLEPYTRVPGAVGDIVDWITSTARRSNRVLALGAAITVVGTLIGRRVAGPTRSATHLYVVTVAPATAGKDHPRRCILPLLEAAGAGTHAHLGDIASQSGFNRAMKASPLCILVIDEIAGFLGRITSPKSSHWERRLSGKLREQWSCNFGAIGTMTAADYADTHIYCPAMSIFGTSTDVEFWSVLQGSEIENGFFSRFLVLASNRQAPDQDPPGDPFKVPDALVTRLSELYLWGQKSPDNCASQRPRDPLHSVRLAVGK